MSDTPKGNLSCKQCLEKWEDFFNSLPDPREAIRNYCPQPNRQIPDDRFQEASGEVSSKVTSSILGEGSKPVSSQAPHERSVLHLATEASYQGFCEAVLNISIMTDYIRSCKGFDRQFISNLNTLENYLKKAFENLSFSKDDEFTKTVACKVVDILSQRLTGVMEGCFMGSRCDRKDEVDFSEGLKEKIETYLENIPCLQRIEVREGDVVKDNELEYWSGPNYVSKGTRKDKCYEQISVYPYVLYYQNEDGEVAETYIEGHCIVS